MKMSYRHRLVLILLIAITVSVFFAFCLCSCGIPTYWQPKNSTDTVITKTTSDNSLSFNVKVNFYSGDDGSNAPQFGLALLYVFSDENNSALSTELVKTFNSKYRGTSPNGASLSCEKGTAIWDFTVEDSTYNVYAFTDASDQAISAPHYNKAISSNTDFSKSYTLKLNSDVSGIELTDSDENTISQLNFGLSVSDLEDLKDSEFIHVYAALSAQGNNYSNIYWSNLTYVGSFSNFNSNDN